MRRNVYPPTLDLAKYRDGDGNVHRYAWPGGYPLYYTTADCGVLCPLCVDAEAEAIAEADATGDDQWRLIAADVNWEDPHLYCDHCDERIESAYAEPTEGDDLATGDETEVGE